MDRFSDPRSVDERFRIAVEAASNAMLVVNCEGTIMVVNSAAERLFGYEKGELVGQAIEILVPESVRQNHACLRDEFSAMPELRPMGKGRSLRGRHKDGSEFVVEVGLIPIETQQGIWVLSSISETGFQSQRLESIGLLAGGIAHDFNNLLGAVLADSELALSELSAGLIPLDEIQHIRTVSIRAAEIARELMTYTGQETAHREAVDFSQLVREMVELLRVSISKGATLRTDLPESLPAVPGNAAQLRQVVMNLVLNASEAIQGRGVIDVTTSQVRVDDNLVPPGGAELPRGDYVRLEVSDTGHGMSEEEQAKIFDPFFTTKSAGWGLGLAVVQGIVREHGGTIHLVSRLGHGTTFQIFLPCVGQGAQSSKGAAQLEEIAMQGRSGAVLLVEDEEALRVPVAKMLRRNGYSVIEAIDGPRAIESLRAWSGALDLVLLDATVPGASSAEIQAEVLRRRPEAKIVLTSAYSPDRASSPDGDHRISGFIRKPFQLNELLRLIRGVLAKDGNRKRALAGDSGLPV